jgi:quinolinate synthase
LKYTEKEEHNEFIVATETGILHQMQKSSPHKTFIPAPPNNSCACNDCPHMKLNTLEKLYISMKYEMPEILMDDERFGLPQNGPLSECWKSVGTSACERERTRILDTTCQN